MLFVLFSFCSSFCFVRFPAPSCQNEEQNEVQHSARQRLGRALSGSKICSDLDPWHTPGLHRPPAGTQHCAPLSTCCTCTARSARCRRSNDASPASPERPLRFPRSAGGNLIRSRASTGCLTRGGGRGSNPYIRTSVAYTGGLLMGNRCEQGLHSR